jgi:hypothetical protein
VRSLTSLFGRRSTAHAFSLTPALSRRTRVGVRPPRVGGSIAGLRRRAVRAALKAPQSRRSAKPEAAAPARQRLDCGAFSTAFQRARTIHTQRNLSDASPRPRAFFSLSRWAREGVRPPRVGGSTAGLRQRAVRAALKPPQSRRSAQPEAAAPSRQRLDCGAFSTAFQRARTIHTQRKLSAASPRPRACFSLAPTGGEGRGEGARRPARQSVCGLPHHLRKPLSDTHSLYSAARPLTHALSPGGGEGIRVRCPHGFRRNHPFRLRHA